MKTKEVKTGVKETTKSFLVDIDDYTGRDRFYQGSMAGQVILIDKAKYPNLLNEGYNDYYDTELDVIIAMFNDGDTIKGVKLYRQGYKVQ